MVMGYRNAVRWLILNDGCNWLDEENSALPVAAALVADIYGKSDDEIRGDLSKLWSLAKSPGGLAEIRRKVSAN